MKNLLPIFFAIFTLALMSSCTTTRTFTTSEGSYEGIEVYTAKNPGKDFNEIKFIEVGGGWFSGPKGLMKKLVQRAKESGADGLVNVQYNTLHVGSTISGTAVKFEETVE
jgi:hypothetical protein